MAKFHNISPIWHFRISSFTFSSLREELHRDDNMLVQFYEVMCGFKTCRVAFVAAF